VELMLVDFTSPPCPAWSVEQLRRILQPAAQPQLELADMQPEWKSYDTLLNPMNPIQEEVTYVR